MISCPICFEHNNEETFGGIRICKGCFHGWRHPLVVNRDYQQMATSVAYSPERARSQIEFLGRTLFSGMRLFELGCGHGSLAASIKQHLPRVTYHGIEPSPDAIKANATLDRVWREWPGEELRRESYHLAVASHVLEHTADVASCLDQLTTLLTDDGALFLEVPNGSGHPSLPFDTNPGHLHFFSVNSLNRLLSRCQFRIESMATGAYESPRYPDSLRVIAKPFEVPCFCGDELAGGLGLAKNEKLVVWGAGGLAQELLGPFLPASLIQCFLDRRAEELGGTLLGRPVHSPSHLAELSDVTLLISSLDFETEIRQEIQNCYAASVTRIISMREVLTPHVPGPNAAALGVQVGGDHSL